MEAYPASQQWGLTSDLVASLPERLGQIFARFRPSFRTQTHNGSQHAWTYLKELLTMPMERNFPNLERRVCAPEADGQAIQHFMSDSPWSGHTVMQTVQIEIAAHPAFQTDGVLPFDKRGHGDNRIHPVL